MEAHSRTTCNRRWALSLLKLANVLLGLGLLVSSGFAHAIACGDIVGPGGLEVLDGDLEECEASPALTIEGPIIVDLNGNTISCALAEDGSLTGTGIELTGSRARVRDGTIENCSKAVVVDGDGRHRLRELTVTSPDIEGDEGIGFQVKSSRNRFIENAVEEYAGEGFRLGDDGVPADRNVLKQNVARNNASHGFRVRLGEKNLLLRNLSDNNAEEGFRSQGRGNRFIANTAIGNGDEGFRLRDQEAEGNLLSNNFAEGNGLVPCNPLPPVLDVNPGIAVTRQSASNKIINNITDGNCLGIAVETGSFNNNIINNTALDNKLQDLVDGNLDCDENKWKSNDFETSAAGPDLSDLFPDCIQ